MKHSQVSLHSGITAAIAACNRQAARTNIVHIFLRRYYPDQVDGYFSAPKPYAWQHPDECAYYTIFFMP
jgi:hypothetical protein